MVELQQGDEFAGHRLEGVAGRGGMGVVYRARQLDLDRVVALKLIAPSLAEDPDFRERFIAESRLAAAIDHPNVIPVYYAGEHAGRLYIAMRYVEGDDLRTVVRREGRLPAARAAHIVGQVGAALDAAHARGLVHRDVKPANVLLDAGDHAYLTDFGLTKRIQTTGVAGGGPVTRTGGWVGTLGYVSPEQIRGERVDARSDVYALGCVLFHALTGGTPYQRESDEATLWAHLHDPPPPVSAIAPDVPAAFEDVVARALAKDPADRYQSAGDLGRAALAAAGRHDALAPERVVAVGPAAPPVDAPTVASPDDAETVQRTTALEGRRRRARPPRLAAAGALLAVAVAAGVIVALLSGGDGQRPATSQPQRTATAPTARTAGQVTLHKGAGQRPNAVVATRTRVWVVSSRSSRATVLSSTTGQLSRHAPAVGTGATAVAAGFGSVWIAKGATQSLLRYGQTSAKRLGPAIGLPPGNAVAAAAGAGAVWVGSRARHPGESATVTKVTPSTGQTQVIPVPRGIQNLAVGDGGLWVISADQEHVTRIDVATGQASRPLPTGRGAYAVAVGAGSAWVTNSTDATVTQISTKAPYRRVRTIRVGHVPQGIDVAGGAVWVADNGDDAATRIDAKTGRVVGEPLDVGSEPFAVSVRGHAAWFTLLGDNAVARVSF